MRVGQRLQYNELQRAEAIRIGRRLQWAREAHGMTKAQLAFNVNVHHALIGSIERGERVPSVFLAMSLIHVLRISPQYLLWGILQGIEEELLAKLSRGHPELLLPNQLRHADTPDPGKTGKSRRSTCRGAPAQKL